MGKSLNVFCDESGDTGFDNGASKYYVVSLVFHDNRFDISNQLNKFKHDPVFHTGPIIRREDTFKNMSVIERKHYLNKLVILYSILPITHKEFIYKKKGFNENESHILFSLVKDISFFLNANIEYFMQFDAIKIYYDNGQQIVFHALVDAFNLLKHKIILKNNVRQEKYRLLQIADFISSLKLVEMKFANGELSKSEQRMFENKSDFKRTYLRLLSKKEFK
ncbi:MAG: DUF3800 domain-containing protein [Bacilli bacterium]|nr:DUF3800 domain-containing protein [Bacilli bacterium]